MSTWVNFGNWQKREYLDCPLCWHKYCVIYTQSNCVGLLLSFAISHSWNNDYICAFPDSDDCPWEDKNAGWTDITMEMMQYIEPIDEAHKELIDKYRQEKEANE